MLNEKDAAGDVNSGGECGGDSQWTGEALGTEVDANGVNEGEGEEVREGEE